jgi:hypothetical protein
MAMVRPVSATPSGPVNYVGVFPGGALCFPRATVRRLFEAKNEQESWFLMPRRGYG